MKFTITRTGTLSDHDISVYELEDHGFKIRRVDDEISVIEVKGLSDILLLAEITGYDIIVSPARPISGVVGNLEIYDGYRE